MSEKIVESTPLGRITLPSESASALAPRADPTPEVAHSGDVSRLDRTHHGNGFEVTSKVWPKFRRYRQSGGNSGFRVRL